MEKTDHIAIALATYNGEKFIREQLDSLLNQTYTNWTCYIHDDGSSDATVEICEDYARRYSEHFKIIADGISFRRPTANFMHILTFVKEPYLMFCDQDDIWHPEKLEICLKTILAIEKPGMPALVFNDAQLIDADGNYMSVSLGYATSYTRLQENNELCCVDSVVLGCTLTVNRQLYTEVRKITNLGHVCGFDWLCFTVNEMLDGSSAFVAQKLNYYRIHGNNSVGIRNRDIIHSLGRNLQAIVHGQFRDKVEIVMVRPRLQCREIVDNLDISNPQHYSFLQQFSAIGVKNKWERIRFYRKHFYNWPNLKRYLLWI